MAQQDIKPGDNQTPAEREAHEKALEDTKSSLAAGEVAEDDALAVLREETEQGPSNTTILERTRTIARYITSDDDYDLNDVDWKWVQTSLDESRASAEASGEILVYGGPNIDAAHGYTKEDAIRIVKEIGREIEKKKIRGKLAEIAKINAELALLESSWESIADEKTQFIVDIKNVVHNKENFGTLETYQEKFPGIAMEDFQFMISVYRKKIIRMMIDAKGKSPYEYRQRLERNKIKEEKLKTKQS